MYLKTVHITNTDLSNSSTKISFLLITNKFVSSPLSTNMIRDYTLKVRVFNCCWNFFYLVSIASNRVSFRLLCHLTVFPFASFLTDCGTPNINTGTIVSVFSTTLGSIAEYSCAEGYENFFGDEQRVCQSDGSWSGVAPTCTIKSTGTYFFVTK